MGPLRNVKWEEFAQRVASGVSQREAFRLAGYAGDGGTANRLMQISQVRGRIAELHENRAMIEVESVEDAMRRSTVTKYGIIMELKAMGFGNISNFFRKTNDGQLDLIDGLPVLDFNHVTDPEMYKAIKEIIVEEYTDGFGEDAREVKRTRVVLHDKKGPLMELARMHGMVKPANIQFNQQNNTNNTVIMLNEDELNA